MYFFINYILIEKQKVDTGSCPLLWVHIRGRLFYFIKKKQPDGCSVSCRTMLGHSAHCYRAISERSMPLMKYGSATLDPLKKSSCASPSSIVIQQRLSIPYVRTSAIIFFLPGVFSKMATQRLLGMPGHFFNLTAFQHFLLPHVFSHMRVVCVIASTGSGESMVMKHSPLE